MRTGTTAVLIGVSLALSFGGLIAVNGSAVFADDKPAAAAATEDVIFMRDGRELHGQILNETKSLIIFEYADQTMKVKTKMTLLKDEIAQIDRDVAITAEAKPAETKPAAAAPAATTTSTTKKTAEAPHTYGITRVKDSVAAV